MDSLEALYHEARTNTNVSPGKTPKHREEAQTGKTLYLDPDNWQRTRGIALIHSDTDSLLGNFSEYVHTKISGCRKLVREPLPITVSGKEFVSGSWWIEQAKRPEARQDWLEKRQAILHIYLPELKAHAPACEVVAHVHYGAIARVELAVDTTFAQSEGAETLLELSAGTNILEVMSLDSKMKLREEIAL